jgi:L-alanine-DL-glutamate epimerase-like enolase superfamily enzyme
MKITALETLRTEEFSNVLWVRVHTDSGTIGLGETFYGAGAVEAHIHETLADRLIGRNPLHIEALNKEMVSLPMAQSSTGVEYRAASAVDIALWDLFGKVCNQPVSRLLGGNYRSGIKPYGSILFDEPGPLTETLHATIARGFKAIKLGWRPFGRRDTD